MRRVVILALVLLSFTAVHAKTPLEKAVAAIGGQEAVESLESISYDSSGRYFVTGESFLHGFAAIPVNDYQSTVIADLEEERLRRDTVAEVFFPFPNNLDYREVIVGREGFIDGVDNPFFPTPRPMVSDRLASENKEFALLNPVLLLKQALEEPELVSDGGTAKIRGKRHHVLNLDLSVWPVSIYINKKNGRIARVSTREHNHIFGDVSWVADFRRWSKKGGTSVRWPRIVNLYYDDQSVLQEHRSNFAVNGDLDDQLFRFPEGITGVYNEEDAARGEASPHTHQEFEAIGVPFYDGLQTTVQAVPAAPGVYYLGGGTHGSLAIEQENGVIVADAPLNEERSLAVIDWVNENIPNKPITHIINTHHHSDHTGGLRTYIAFGAQVIQSESASAFLDDVLATDRTIRPDLLAQYPVVPDVNEVPHSGKITVWDPERPVVLIHQNLSEHSGDNLVVWLPQQQVLFNADMFGPGIPPIGNEAALLDQKIREEDLAVQWVVGAHGGIATIEDLRAAANK